MAENIRKNVSEKIKERTKLTDKSLRLLDKFRFLRDIFLY